MALARRNGKVYFYQPVRHGNRVRNVYLGCGEAGRRLALASALESAKRHEQREQQRAEVEALEAIDQDQAERYDAVEETVRERLEALGFRKHARGAWRRRRTMTTPATVTKTTDDDDADLGWIALQCAVEHAFTRPEQADVRAAIYAQADRLHTELAPKGCPAVERLLAERCIMCWFDVHRLELRATVDGLSDDELVTISRFLDRAHNRYVRALTALAKVRKLDLGHTELIMSLRAAIPRRLTNGAAPAG